MSFRELICSGFRLTLNVTATLVLFFTFITLFRGEYWAITLDTLAQLLITTIYERGFDTQLGVFKVPNDQLETNETRNGLAPNESPGGAITAPPSRQGNPQVVACVVGWREEPHWYTQCLNSVADNWNCDALVAGIDGDEPEDEGMVDVFRTVCPQGIITRLPKTLSEVLKDIISSKGLDVLHDTDAQRLAMEDLQDYARRSCRDSEVLRPNVHHTRAICIVQPHGSKKDILFSCMVFATVLAKDVDTQVIFSTDSDTIVYPDALENIARKVNSDVRIGGVSGHMRFLHEAPTYISQLAAAYYWYQQDIAKIQGSMFGFNECQPGPCAGFRVAALERVLVSWVDQKVCGQKMISNEDRHFTTRLLAAGYSVVHVPNAVVETDTPNLFQKWIRQQVRWMRGTMIETTAYPSMLHRLSPWPSYTIAKTRILPLLTFWVVAHTAVAGHPPEWLGLGSHLYKDWLVSVALQMGYLLLCRPNGVGARWSDLLWVLPSLPWFFLWSPAIVIWSLLTVLDGSWGTPMRATVGAQAPEGVSQNSGLSRLQRAMAKDMTFMFLWVVLVIAAVLALLGVDLATWFGVAARTVREIGGGFWCRGFL